MKEGKICSVLCMAAALTCLVAHAAAQANAGANMAEAKSAIVKSNQLYFQAFAKNDVSILISLYAEDCWIMPPNAPALCGPAASRDFFTEAYNTFGVRNGKFITIDVYGIAGDMVAELGFWQLNDANNIEFDDGKFLVLWKKTATGWKRWRDSFNSSRNKK